MQQLDPSRFPGNPEMVERLHTQVMNDVDKLELQIRRNNDDPKTGQVIEDDITKQTDLVMQNIKAILDAAGTSLDRTVKTTVYLKDMNDFDAMGSVYARYFPENPPARATVEVARLHGGRVEIELVAVA